MQFSTATSTLQCWWILFQFRYYFLHTRNYRLTPWWIHWRKVVCGSQQIKTFCWETYLKTACRWTYNDYGILHTLTKKQVMANTWGTISVSEWCGKNRFENLCSKQGEQYYAQYPGLLASDDYTNYIKDPFNKDKTSTYLRVTSPHYKVSGTKGEPSFPPYGIT